MSKYNYLNEFESEQAAPSSYNYLDEIEGVKPSDEYIPETSSFEALSRGLAEGATLGFSGEILSGLGATKDVIMNNENFKKAFEKRLKEQTAEEKLAASKHPWLFGGGAVAGSLAIPIPGARLKAAGTLGKIGVGALKGGIAGAAYGAGTAEGGIEERLEGAATGGLVGGLAGGALEPIIGLAGGYAKRAGDYGKKYYKKVYNDLPIDKNKLEQISRLGKKGVGSKQVEGIKTEVGKLADDFNVNVFKTPSAQYDAAQEMKDVIGKSLKKSLGEADELVAGKAINPNNVIKGLNKAREEILSEATGVDEGSINRYFDKQIKQLSDRYLTKEAIATGRGGMDAVTRLPSDDFMSFIKVNDLITDVTDKINNFVKLSAQGKKLLQVRGELKNILDNRLKEVGKFKEVQPIKRKYELATGIADATKEKLRDKITPEAAKGAQAGLSRGTQTMQYMQGIKGGAFLALAKFLGFVEKNTRKAGAYKDSTLRKLNNRIASSLPKLSQGQKQALDKAAQRGVQAVIATDYLLRQRDPKYRKLMENREN